MGTSTNTTNTTYFTMDQTLSPSSFHHASHLFTEICNDWSWRHNLFPLGIGGLVLLVILFHPKPSTPTKSDELGNIKCPPDKCYFIKHQACLYFLRLVFTDTCKDCMQTNYLYIRFDIVKEVIVSSITSVNQSDHMCIFQYYFLNLYSLLIFLFKFSIGNCNSPSKYEVCFLL